MAIFCAGWTPCAICGQAIADMAGARGLPAFTMPDADSALQRLSDNCVHQSCLDAWPRRVEFIARFNQAIAGTRIARQATLTLTAEGGVDCAHQGKTQPQ